MLNPKRAISFDENAVDAIFAELNPTELPGAAVGIAVAGVPVYRKGFGLAKMDPPIGLFPTTRMRIGSVSKQFAALTYLLLCEEGKAGIDDSIAAHVPETHPVTHAVTMRQLMGHVSGLRDSYNICVQFGGAVQRVSTSDLVELYRDIDDVNAAPGTAWIYNNGGYQLLSTAIERIADRPLEDVLRERIFDPLDMQETVLRRWDTMSLPNSASLHAKAPDGGFKEACFGVALAGEGGIVSTVDDMLRWLAHMETPQVGSAASWEAMRTSQVLANGTSTGYGLGLRINQYRGNEIIWHAGGLVGGNSHVVKVPAAGLDIVVLVNRHDVSASAFAEKVLDSCFSGSDSLTGSATAPLVSGIFLSTSNRRCIQLTTEHGKQTASIDGNDVVMTADDEGVLRPSPPKSHVKQWIALLGDRHKPSAIRFGDYGNVDELTAQEPPERTPACAIACRYRSKSTAIDAIVEPENRLTTLTTHGSAEFSLEPLAKNIWRARSASFTAVGGVLSFDDDRGRFHFSSERTRALPFHRID